MAVRKTRLAKELRARRDARNDPNAFIEYVRIPDDETGEPIRQAKHHIEMQAFFSANRLALIQEPRFHGKTMQILPRVAWELGRNSSLRVAIFCQNEKMAIRRVTRLKRLIDGKTGRRVRNVFPHLRIDSDWSDRLNEFSVVRDGEPVDPSVVAYGITGSGTGARADLIICDDMVDLKNSGTAGERDKVYERFTNDVFQYLPPTGRCWVPHTPWHEDDAHARIVREAQQRDSGWVILTRAIVYADPPKGPESFDPLWPEYWTAERLWIRYKEIGDRAFSHAFGLRVISDADRVFARILFFDYDGMVALQRDPKTRHPFRSYVAVDPAFSTKRKSNYTGMIAGWVDVHGGAFLHDALRQKIPDHLLVNRIEDYCRQHRADYCIVEDAVAQRMIVHALRERGIKVIAAKPQQAGRGWTDKRSRGSGVSRFFGDGTIRIAGRRVAGGFVAIERMREAHHQLDYFTGDDGNEDDLADAAIYLAHKAVEPWARAKAEREADVAPMELDPKTSLIKQLREAQREDMPEPISKRIWGWN